MLKQIVLISAGLLIVVSSGCDFTYKLKSGQEAFDVKRYAVAVEMLQTEYSETQVLQSRAQKAFLLGQSYSFIGENEKALDWYRQAVEDEYGTLALEKYAETCKQLERYDEAVEVYRQLMSAESQSLRYRQQMIACQQAAQWLEDEVLKCIRGRSCWLQ